MPFLKRVANVGQLEFDGGGLAGRERFRLLKAVAESAAHDIAADQLLIAAHAHAGRVRIGVGVIVGIDVDQLDDPVRVGAGRGDVQVGDDRPRQGDVLLQNVGLVNEDVRPARGEALVGAHVVGLHAATDLVDVRHQPGWVADEFVEAGLGGAGLNGESALSVENGASTAACSAVAMWHAHAIGLFPFQRSTLSAD